MRILIVHTSLLS